MSYRLACCLLLLSVFCLLPATARADEAQDLHAAYGQLDAAYSRRDIPAIMAFLTPTFARHTWNSTLNSVQYQAEMKDDFYGTVSVTAVTKIQMLSVRGDTADALVSRRIDLTLPKPLPEIPPPYFTIKVIQEHWQRIDGQWRMTTMEDTPLVETLCLLNARDQGIRRQFFTGQNNPFTAAQMGQVDAADRTRLKQIMRQYGWPGFDLVGTQGDNYAFLIVQHSDNDQAFQKRCLPLIEAAVKARQAMPSDAAYLTDRILTHKHKPQIYGTQWHIPIADPAHVDQRRASVGLGPLAVYEAQLKQVYQPNAKP